MTRGRTPFAAAVAVAALLVGSCSSGVTEAPALTAVGDAGKVDMCTILTNAELTTLGIELNSRKQENVSGEIGCGWVGHPITLTLVRDNDSVITYKARRHDPAFVTFTDNTVSSRSGVQIRLRSDGSQCTQLMDGGRVSMDVSVALAFSLDPPKIDPCAEALRIAQMIEPRLPKAGK